MSRSSEGITEAESLSDALPTVPIIPLKTSSERMRELVHQMLEELQEERVRGRLRKVKYVFDTGPLLLYFAGDERVGGFFEDVF